jgi:hypothetical protein
MKLKKVFGILVIFVIVWVSNKIMTKQSDNLKIKIVIFFPRDFRQFIYFFKL